MFHLEILIVLLLFDSRQHYDYAAKCKITRDDLASDGHRLLPVSRLIVD